MCGSPAVGPDNTIYIGSSDHLLAYNPDSSQKWIFEYEHNFMGNPTVGSDGTVYATTNDGYLYAVNPNGSLKWRFINKEDWCNDAIIDYNGNIYYGTIFENNLYCFDSNGSEIWRYRAPHGFDYCAVIANDGTIYAKDIDYLIALNPDKSEKWKISISPWGGNPSLSPDGKIILSGLEEFITAIDPADGSILWQYEIPFVKGGVDDVSEVAIGAEGNIYFAYTHDVRIGFLCALSPNGKLLWETQLLVDIQPYNFLHIRSEPAIGEDGTVFVTTDGSYQGPSNIEEFGFLYAINVQNPSPAPESINIAGETDGKVGIEYN